MIEDLKNRVGYVDQNTISLCMTPSLSTQSLSTSVSIEQTKQTKEEMEKLAYQNYQTQYHTLLQKPKPVDLRTPEKGDEKIKNMDELIEQQIKLREMDLAKIVASSASSSFASASVSASASSKIKIMDPIESDEISQEISTIITKAAIPTPSPTVTWSPHIEEHSVL